MVSKDLRTWIEKLEAEGGLKRIKAKVDCEGEMQEIGYRLAAEGGPAVLFENIEGHESTWCRKLFLGGLATLGRYALMLGLPKDAPAPAIIQRLRETLRNPIGPTHVKTGPVKENIIKGKALDLYQIPVPQWHPGDRGRYINVWVGVVTKDPENGEYNVGCYRGMIIDKNHIALGLWPNQGWGIHYQKYQALGKPMPVACVYGWDPSLVFTAGSPVTTITEYEWMGAIRGEAVPLVKCETSDLEVPATAEIVVEGTVAPDPATYQIEAPYKEVTGTYCEPRKRPVMELTSITYRNNPIYQGSATGIPPEVNETMLLVMNGSTAILLNALEDEGVPGVLSLTLAPLFCVKIHKYFQGHAMQVASALFGHKGLTLPFKVLFVVEEEVNIHDPVAVIAAVNENVDPARDIHVFPTQNANIDTALSSEDSDPYEYGVPLGNKLLIDATVNWIAHPRRAEWGGARVPPREPRPAQDVEKVEKRWKKYGF